jgi:hypothetical protein
MEVFGMMTRKEHLDLCKKRALAYVGVGDLQGAFQSMASDLDSHGETAGHIGITLGMMQLMAGQLSTKESMQHFIEGFN